MLNDVVYLLFCETRSTLLCADLILTTLKANKHIFGSALHFNLRSISIRPIIMDGGTLAEDRWEIVFFNVKTTIPFRTGQGYAILEFGSIMVCPKKLLVLKTYATLVKPIHVNLISYICRYCRPRLRYPARSVCYLLNFFFYKNFIALVGVLFG